MSPEILRTIAITAVVAFLMFRRVRRNIGRQPLRKRSSIVRIVILSLVCLVLLPIAAFNTGGLAGAGVGVLAGLALAYYALKHTSFENTAEGLFYTPNRWIGLGVSALIIGRMAARFADQPAMADGPNGALTHAFQRSPLILALYFVYAAYYIAYTAAVLRRAKTLASPVPAPGA